jgi:hypothetical protein
MVCSHQTSSGCACLGDRPGIRRHLQARIHRDTRPRGSFHSSRRCCLRYSVDGICLLGNSCTRQRIYHHNRHEMSQLGTMPIRTESTLVHNWLGRLDTGLVDTPRRCRWPSARRCYIHHTVSDADQAGRHRTEHMH